MKVDDFINQEHLFRNFFEQKFEIEKGISGEKKIQILNDSLNYLRKVPEKYKEYEKLVYLEDSKEKHQKKYLR